MTGDQITLSVLYMFPVIIGSWAFGTRAGLMVAVAAATLIALVGFHSGHPFSHAGYFLINVASALFSFVLVTVLASHLRRALDRERALARTDFLTGIANRTAFYEVVGREIERQRRYQRPLDWRTSIATTSRRSTTDWGITPATNCCAVSAQCWERV